MLQLRNTALCFAQSRMARMVGFRALHAACSGSRPCVFTPALPPLQAASNALKPTISCDLGREA
jgi:hypothetical protein